MTNLDSWLGAPSHNYVEEVDRQVFDALIYVSRASRYMGYLLAALVFALVVAVFAVQNTLPVEISFMGWKFQTSLVLVVIGSATLGGLAVAVLSIFGQLRLRRQLRELKSKVKPLEVPWRGLAVSQTGETVGESEKS